MRVLTCEAGHEWEHRGGRGRPPKACPEHASPMSRQAAERHRAFYVAHPRPKVDRPAKKPLSDDERSELASRAAAARWAGVSAEERSAAASKAASARYPDGPRLPRRVVVDSECRFCGEVLRGASRKCCSSAECRRRYNAQRQRKVAHERRARLRGNDSERFDPVEVYERDGWICGLCGEPVNPGLQWPDPLSVSLDHVVPVSLGGPHTRANTRCSHLGCNSRRGNRVASPTAQVAAV